MVVEQGIKEIPQIKWNEVSKRYYINAHADKRGGEDCLIIYDKRNY